MFENQHIGVCAEDGRELMCGDIVESVFECECSQHIVRGIVTYDPGSSAFMLDIPHKGMALPLSSFINADITYLGSDAAASLGADHPLLKSAPKKEQAELGTTPNSAMDAMPALCERFIAYTAHFENSEKDILRSFVRWALAQHQ